MKIYKNTVKRFKYCVWKDKSDIYNFYFIALYFFTITFKIKKCQ